MQSAPVGGPLPDTQFIHESLPPLPLSPSHVSSGPSAKKAVIDRSRNQLVDAVVTPSHKCRLKFSETTLNEPSQKVLPPLLGDRFSNCRISNTINHPERPEDGECNHCSDKPDNTSVHRNPTRPNEDLIDQSGHLHYWHPKRIVLVKNLNPAVQRSIILHRRTLRSLQVFMDEVSELMQSHIRQLYTLDGHKIDSIQSLMQCPSVLVCVGWEHYCPHLMGNITKHSNEKLPRLFSRSHPTICSNSHESNFRLETKKSIIHPRCNFSNKMGRFPTPEKSVPQRLSSLGKTSHISGCSHAKESTEDDIEKRVHVSKDGSLSLEMNVRFHLLNDETLQWSTQIKKSPGATSDYLLESEDHSGSFAGSECDSPCETENVYLSKLHQKHLEEPQCPQCCSHCQEYATWKNTVDEDHVRHIESSSSSTSSHLVMRKNTSIESLRTMSHSSEEYTEHIVQNINDFAKIVGDEDTMAEHCTTNHYCSLKEVCNMSTKSKAISCTGEKCEMTDDVQKSDKVETKIEHTKDMATDHVSVKISKVTEEDRSLSSISNSSQVLQSLKEDPDEDDALASSPSQIYNSEGDEHIRSACSSPGPMHHLSPKIPNHTCTGSMKLTKSRKISRGNHSSEQRIDTLKENNEKSNNATWSTSEVTQPNVICFQNSGKKDSSFQCISERCNTEEEYERPEESGLSGKIGDTEEETDRRVESVMSLNSNSSASLKVEMTEMTDLEKGVKNSLQSNTANKSNILGISAKLKVSEKPVKTEDNLSQIKEDKVSTTVPLKSNVSVQSRKSKALVTTNELEDMVEEKEIRVCSVMSIKSNTSMSSKSEESENHIDKTEDTVIKHTEHRVTTATSHMSGVSTKSGQFSTDEKSADETEEVDEGIEYKPRTLSLKSNTSAKSNMSKISDEPDEETEDMDKETKVKMPNSLLTKLNALTRFRKFKISEKQTDKDINGTEEETEHRVPSAVSLRSNTSTRSKSKASENSEDNEEVKEETEDRVPSVLSLKSNASVRSRKSKGSQEYADEFKDGVVGTKIRISSAMSIKSNTSPRSKRKNMSENPFDEQENVGKENSQHTVSVQSDVSRSGKTAASEDFSKHTEEVNTNTDCKVPSALSNKSKSTKPKKSNISENSAIEIEASKDNIENQVRHGILLKSNISQKSADEFEDDGEETEIRIPREIPAKSNASANSKKSNVSENLAVETENVSKKDSGHTVSHAMSVKVSTTSGKSAAFENLVEHIEDVYTETEYRVPSAMSDKSNASGRSKNSKVSEKSASELAHVTEEKLKDRVPHCISLKSNTLQKSVDDSEDSVEGKEIQIPSAMSVKSNTSARSKKSTVSENPVDDTDRDKEDMQRAPSTVSFKSDISVRSGKYTVSENPEDPKQVEEGTYERVPSAMSAKSKASASPGKLSEKPVDENKCNAEEKTEYRVPTALSVKSNSSRSREFKASLNDEFEHEAEIRVPSALSLRSNTSTASKSKVYRHSTEDTEVVKEETEDRVPSAMSSKSNISITIRTEEGLESMTNEFGEEEETKVRAPSALSMKSYASTSSRKSKISEQSPDETENRTEKETEYNILSAMSRKSNTSPGSKKSKVSGKLANDLKDCIEETAEARVPSGMSLKSNASSRSRKSKTSKKSPEEFEGGVEEGTEIRIPSAMSIKLNTSARSKKSNVSKNPQDDTEHVSKEDAEHRFFSAMSVKSNTLARSKKSMSEKPTSESVDEADEEQLKASSVQSLKSNISDKSKSSLSETLVCKYKENIGNEDTSQKIPDDISAKSNVSIGSVRPKISNNHSNEAQDAMYIKEERNSSTVLFKSNASAGSKISMKNGKKEEREVSMVSVMSSKSNASTCSEVSEKPKSETKEVLKYRVPDLSEKRNAPSESKVLDAEEDREEREEETKERVLSQESFLSHVQAKPAKSKKSGTLAVAVTDEDKELESMLIKTDSSVKLRLCEASQKYEDEIVRTPKPPKINGTDLETNEMDEELSSVHTVHSTASQSSKSSKCHCSASERTSRPKTSVSENLCENNVGKAKEVSKDSGMSVKSIESTKSKMNGQIKCTTSDRALTLSSFASVSIGLVEDEGEGAERAMSVSSGTSDQSKFIVECERKCIDEKSSATSQKGTVSDQSTKSKSKCHKGTDNVKVHSSLSFNGSAHGNSQTKAPNISCQVGPNEVQKSSNVPSSSSSIQRKNKTTPEIASSAPLRSDSSASESDLMEGSKSTFSSASSFLQVKGQKIKLESKTGSGSILSVKTTSSKKASKNDIESDSRRSHSTKMSVTSQNCLNPQKEVLKLNERPFTFPSNDSISSVSEADLSKGDAKKARPPSGKSKSDKTFNGASDKSDKSSKCRKRKSSSSSRRKLEDNLPQLVPSNLPNASPTEVVNEWLKKIPSNSSLYGVGDELNENCSEIEVQQIQDIIMERPVYSESHYRTSEVYDEPKAGIQNLDENKTGEEPVIQTPHDEENESEVKKLADTDTLHTVTIHDVPIFRKKNSLSKTCKSSVQVMKALLIPKLDRCSSLPEVSPIYGRKLSMSARGLLNCLANLQLLDSDHLDISAEDTKCKELMDILQSLWLSDPTNSEQGKKQENNFKHSSMDDELNHKSSGVDVSSGSAGSGKSSFNDGEVKTKKTGVLAQNDTAGMVIDLVALQEENEDEESLNFLPKSVIDTDFPAAVSDPATPDIACRVQWSPTNEDLGIDEEKQVGVEGISSAETIQNNQSSRETMEPLLSKKSSGNNLKLHEETESIHKESPLDLRVPLTKKVSQDPDPLWVLNLLNKIEKQFIKHYVNAMEELKGRWKLDEDQFDIMTNELRDEIQKRIQSSIDRELLKIRSRAGKPKPPKEAKSRESSVQTEQRRQRLKVMYNKSIDAPIQNSEENSTATGTEFSNQRSEDEYCPCDTCMKKKMESKPMEQVELVNFAPVMLDFDLRKILQLKKVVSTNIQQKEYKENSLDGTAGFGSQDENDNLKVVEDKVEPKETEEMDLNNAEIINTESIETDTMGDEENKSVSDRLDTSSEDEQDYLIQEEKQKNTEMEDEFQRKHGKKIVLDSGTGVEPTEDFKSNEAEEDGDKVEEHELTEADGKMVQSDITDETKTAEDTANDETETAEEAEGETVEVLETEVENILETENERRETNKIIEDELDAEVARLFEENTVAHERLDDDDMTKYDQATSDENEEKTDKYETDDCKSERAERQNPRTKINQNDMNIDDTSEADDVQVKGDETAQDEVNTENHKSNEGDSETFANEMSEVSKAAEVDTAEDSGTVKEEKTSQDDGVLQDDETMDSEDDNIGTITREDGEAIETTESTKAESDDRKGETGEDVKTVEETDPSVDGRTSNKNDTAEATTMENNENSEVEINENSEKANETTVNEATESKENKNSDEAEYETTSDAEDEKSYSDEAEEVEFDPDGKTDEGDKVDEKTESLEPETGGDAEYNEAKNFASGEADESETTGDGQTDERDDTVEGDLSETEKSDNEGTEEQDDDNAVLKGSGEFEEEIELHDNDSERTSAEFHDTEGSDETEYRKQIEHKAENIHFVVNVPAIAVEGERDTIKSKEAVNRTKLGKAISEDLDTETANEDNMPGNQSESAEAEDEAEDGSEGEDDSDSAEDIVTRGEDGEESYVVIQEPSLNIGITENVEYEDGAEADVEDSETEAYNAKPECTCAELMSTEDSEFKTTAEKDESVTLKANWTPKKAN